MQRILYICPTSSIGGAETFLKYSWTHGNKNKFHNIYLFFEKGPLFDFFKKNNAEVILLQHKPRLSHLKDWWIVHNLIIKTIREKNIDIVHSTMAYSALFVALACKRTKIPHIWFQHCEANSWMDKMAATLPHQGLICNSNFTYDKQKATEKSLQFFVQSRKSLILHLGAEPQSIDHQERNRWRNQILSKYEISNEDLIISMLCRIHPLKGIDLFLEALATLKKDNIRFHAFIWGDSTGETKYLNDVKRLCEEKRLPVTFAGSTSTPFQALAASDLLVNSSVKPETFGLTIVEAMSAGTPPIGPNEGGPSEIIQDGVNGLLFEPRNSQALTDCIRKFATNESLRQKLKEGAAWSGKNQFNIKNTIQKMEEFYLEFDS